MRAVRPVIAGALSALVLAEDPGPYARKWKAARYHQFGDDPETNLVFDEIEMKRSDLRPGHVLVQVVYAATNPIDVKVMKGQLQGAGWKTPLPMTMGYDFAGFVADVGDGVTSFRKGDQVFGLNWGLGKHDNEGDPVGGAFAEYLAIPAKKVSHKPEGLEMDVAAALPLVGTTAWDVLDKMKVTKGNRVLVIGGSSAVGQVAVQLAKLRGAEVVTTCSGRSWHVCDELGADHLLDYWRTKWYAKYNDLDAVIDCVGETGAFEHAKETLKPGGGFISIASVDAGFDPKGHPPLRYAAFYVLHQNTVIQDRLARLVVDGKLKVRLESESLFRLAGVQIALEHQAMGKSLGKHVIRMEPYMPRPSGDEL